MQYIQEKAIFCKKCHKMTRHIRNSSKPNYLLHLILIIITGGFWIIPFLIILIGGVRIGGEAFRCDACGEKYRSGLEKFFLWIFLGLFGLLVLGLLASLGNKDGDEGFKKSETVYTDEERRELDKLKRLHD